MSHSSGMFGSFLKFEGPGRQHKTTAIVDRAHEYPNFLDRLEEGKARDSWCLWNLIHCECGNAVNHILTCKLLCCHNWNTVEESNCKDLALDPVGGFFLLEPLHPQWASLHGCHDSQALKEGLKYAHKLLCGSNEDSQPIGYVELWILTFYRDSSRSVTLLSNYMMVSFQKKSLRLNPKKETYDNLLSFAEKFTIIAWVLPINKERGTLELKEIYAHVIRGPTRHNQGVVCTVYGI